MILVIVRLELCDSRDCQGAWSRVILVIVRMDLVGFPEQQIYYHTEVRGQKAPR